MKPPNSDYTWSPKVNLGLGKFYVPFTRCWLLDGTTCVLPYVSYFFGYAFYCLSVTRQNLKSSDHQLWINIWWPPNASKHCDYMAIIFVKWLLDGNYLTSYIWISKTWNNQIVDAWFIHLEYLRFWQDFSIINHRYS
jgi:hypothetical protein